MIDLEIIQNLLTSRRNRPFLRDSKKYKLRKLKGIVVHWTANTGYGADDTANRNYFNRTDRYCSAHYIVDHDSITQAIPDTEVAYHTGCVLPNSRSKSRKATDEGVGLGTWENRKWLNPNYTTIGIEACVNKDGDFKQMYVNLVKLIAKKLLENPHLSITDVYRHYDVCGKPCPGFALESEYWKYLLEDVNNVVFGPVQNPNLEEMENTMGSQKPESEPVKSEIIKLALMKWTIDKRKYVVS